MFCVSTMIHKVPSVISKFTCLSYPISLDSFLWLWHNLLERNSLRKRWFVILAQNSRLHPITSKASSWQELEHSLTYHNHSQEKRDSGYLLCLWLICTDKGGNSNMVCLCNLLKGKRRGFHSHWSWKPHQMTWRSGWSVHSLPRLLQLVLPLSCICELFQEPLDWNGALHNKFALLTLINSIKTIPTEILSSWPNVDDLTLTHFTMIINYAK